MSLHQLHQNESLRQREFPICAQTAFWANASVCPLPQRVSKAMQTYLENATLANQEDSLPPQIFLETRELAAEMLNCSWQDIALIGPTSVALSLVASGLPWRPGANVLFYPDDYPSNAVVWMNLQNHGVTPRAITPKIPGCITLDDIIPLIDADTQLVALSSCHFISGYLPDIDAIGAWLHKRGILLCIDGIQTVGALPTSLRHADFLCADAHKWLLGPCAIGIFYVAPEVRDTLEPTLVGWHNVRCPGYLTPDTVVFHNDARRYEAGSPNIAGVVGFHAALKLLKELGSDAIATSIRDLTAALRTGLRDKGYTLLGISDAPPSGITSFRHDTLDMPSLHRELNAVGIATSLRQTRDKQYWLRCSPHGYNTSAELDRIIDHLPSLNSS